MAGAALMLNPYLLLQTYEGHYPHVWASCWYPWAFLGAILMRRGERLGRLLLADLPGLRDAGRASAGGGVPGGGARLLGNGRHDRGRAGDRRSTAVVGRRGEPVGVRLRLGRGPVGGGVAAGPPGEAVCRRSPGRGRRRRGGAVSPARVGPLAVDLPEGARGAFGFDRARQRLGDHDRPGMGRGVALGDRHRPAPRSTTGPRVGRVADVERRARLRRGARGRLGGRGPAGPGGPAGPVAVALPVGDGRGGARRDGGLGDRPPRGPEVGLPGCRGGSRPRSSPSR